MLVNLPADAVPASLLMYRTEARDTAPTSLPLTALGGGRWAANTDGLTSRWYPTVPFTWHGNPDSVNLPYVDLPEVPDLIVSPEKLAKKAKIPLPLSEENRELIIDCIRDAQADVISYLGRQIVPTVFSEAGRVDVFGHWDLTPLDIPLIEITGVTTEMSNGQPTGRFTITYSAGLNVKDDPALSPIRRYITAHAMNSPEFVLLWREATKIRGNIKSSTTDGQSVSYDTPTLGGGGVAGSGAPGALPTKASIDKWRLAGRRIYQRPTRHRPPWPQSSMRGDQHSDIWGEW